MNTQETTQLFFEGYPQKHYDKGEVVIFADDSVPPVFYLEKGTVDQRAISENGTTLALNIFKPGAFFPMSAALNNMPNAYFNMPNAYFNMPNAYFFEAREACVVRVAPAADTVAFLEQHPDIVLDLLKRVYRGVDGILARLTELMAGDAQGLILAELRIAAKRFGADTPSGGTVITITEQQLAEQTGLARETVSKAITRLKAARYISAERGKITLHAKK